MSAPSPRTVRGVRVVTPDGVMPASIAIGAGVIDAVQPYAAAAAAPVLDAGDALVLPGFVDPHVHINEPGRTEWEGFVTATRAAAAGGVTTLIEMPLNAIPATTTLDAFRQKVECARGRLMVDVGFWGGVVPGNAAELEPLWDAGVFGFKCFLVPSGVDEFEHVSEADLERAMPILARLGAPLLVHAEVPGPIELAAELETCVDWNGRRYACYLESRPRAAEIDAIRMMLRLQARFGTRVHIVHLSAADAVPLLREARRQGQAVTVETCPHYLHFAAEDIADGATAWKCAPPIREAANRELLWRALEAGDIDFVATDHSPSTPDLKLLDAGDFGQAWGGIASLEIGARVVWTAMRRRGLAAPRLAEWLSTAPARLPGLASRKGAIAPGHDADLVIMRQDDDVVVDPELLQHRHKVTPYAGERLAGVIDTTIVRGDLVYDRGEFPGAPHGTVLLRNGA